MEKIEMMKDHGRGSEAGTTGDASADRQGNAGTTKGHRKGPKGSHQDWSELWKEEMGNSDDDDENGDKRGVRQACMAPPAAPKRERHIFYVDGAGPSMGQSEEMKGASGWAFTHYTRGEVMDDFYSPGHHY